MKSNMKLFFSVILMTCLSLPALAEKMSKLEIKGMMCAACEGKVKKALNAMDGVDVVRISSSKGVAVVKVADSTTVTEESFKNAIKETGFSVTSVSDLNAKRAKKMEKMKEKRAKMKMKKMKVKRKKKSEG